MKKLLILCLMVIKVYSQDPTNNLVDITTVIPDIVLDIKYATDDNFTGQAVYKLAKGYLVKKAANALKKAAKKFKKKGYRIKLWDGYRPQKVQYIFWGLVKDKFEKPELYVADPKKGSRHNRGAAVDITLVDKDGKELDMGTPFDDFSEKAHRDYKDFSENVLSNRKLLESVMEEVGFVGLPSEWWHFDYKGWENYPLLDIDFEELENVKKPNETV